MGTEHYSTGYDGGRDDDDYNPDDYHDHNRCRHIHDWLEHHDIVYDDNHLPRLRALDDDPPDYD